ncbi:nucleolar protein 16 [Favolaschia claudopus]|uniref:Nucleolar protein 16 n=1 Tax=Favolaschia claudopus TaxID=2862362 RepID=A0AAW0BDF9_9AGAR
MANPRQRKKARSSSHRPVVHARHAKRNLKKTPPIRGPAILSERWDNRKTVRQNYAALGLVHTLNPSASGGMEPIGTATEPLPINLTAASTSSPPVAAPSIPKGHGRIVRDEDGNILSVELAEEDEEMSDETSRDKDMEELAPEVEPQLLSKWVTGLGGGSAGKGVVEGIIILFCRTGAHRFDDAQYADHVINFYFWCRSASCFGWGSGVLEAPGGQVWH